MFPGAALKKNFVFDSLGEVDLRVLVNAMESISVSKGENVITQGLDLRFCPIKIPLNSFFCSIQAMREIIST